MTGKNTPSTAPEKDRKGRDPQEGNSSSQRDFTLYNLEKQELYNVKYRIRFNLASLETSPDSFPFSTWAKTLRDTPSLEPRSDLVSAQDCQGTKRLREAIAWHIRSVRGLEADPDCIVVGAGAQVLYNLIIQLLERPEAVALENPGYGRLASIYEANGIRIFPIPLWICEGHFLRRPSRLRADLGISRLHTNFLRESSCLRADVTSFWPGPQKNRGDTSSKTTTIAELSPRGKTHPLSFGNRPIRARHLHEHLLSNARFGLPHRLHGASRASRARLSRTHGILLLHGSRHRSDGPCALHRARRSRPSHQPNENAMQSSAQRPYRSSPTNACRPLSFLRKHRFRASFPHGGAHARRSLARRKPFSGQFRLLHPS